MYHNYRISLCLNKFNVKEMLGNSNSTLYIGIKL